MGVGTPLDLLEAVHRGVDMFDCILPTALGKRGGVFTSRGYLQLRRGVHKHADEALDPACDCPTCQHHSRAYLHHLTKTDEALGWQLLGQHNLHFYHRLMREIRQSILDDTFASLYKERRRQLEERDLDNPSSPPRARPARPLALGGYEVHVAREGFASIRHVASGEVMHARTPPMVEAQSLYVEQSGLAERLQLGPAENARTPRRSCSGTWGSGPGPTRWPPSAATSRRPPSMPSAPSRSSASRTISTPCGSPSPTGTTSPICATALPRASSARGAGARVRVRV